MLKESVEVKKWTKRRRKKISEFFMSEIFDFTGELVA
jgi:hypothetical protein